MELPDAVANVLDLLVCKGGIHRQQKATREQPVRKWEIYTCETQAIKLVHRFPGPLDDRADTVLFQLCTQLVAPPGLDLVVLIDVEVVRVTVRPGRQHEILQSLQTLAVTSRNVPSALYFELQLLEFHIKHRCLEIVQARVQ